MPPIVPCPSKDSISLEAIEDLRELVDQDTPNFLNDLLHSFIADAQHQLTEMKAALQQDDLNTTMQVAHALKSTSGNVGAFHLAHCCEKIETQARDKTLLGVVELHTQAVEEFANVHKAIRALPDFS